MHENNWALILGGSSGFGLATAKQLAANGMNIFVVHRDRKGAWPRIEKEFQDIQKHPIKFCSINANALTPEGQEEILTKLADELGSGKVGVLLHSVALGNLKPIAPPLSGEDSILCDDEDFSQTIYNMGINLFSWVKAVFKRKMFAPDSRVFGLTSEGNSVVWSGYAPVSAAKCVLESISRSIAVEYGPHGIRCNILQPGITETPALKLIPGHENMVSGALKRNPLGRLTTPEDVAKVIGLLSKPEAAWINGSLIRIDGGEHISG